MNVSAIYNRVYLSVLNTKSTNDHLIKADMDITVMVLGRKLAGDRLI